MKSTYTIIITLIALILAPLVSAGPLTDLHTAEQDIDAFFEFLDWSVEESTGEYDDVLLEQQNAVLPEIEAEEGEREAEEERGRRTVLAVDVDGRRLTYHDVPTNEWFAPFVRFMTEREIVSGFKDEHGNSLGEFRPANPVTVEQLAKIAVEVADIELTCAEPKNEAALKSWSTAYIGCAEERGWGVYSDGSVQIDRPALRGEVVFTLLQAFEVAGLSTDPGWRTGFSDVPTSHPFAVAIGRARQDGLVHGYSNKQGIPTGVFGPSDSVTRAAIAKIVTNAVQLYGE